MDRAEPGRYRVHVAMEGTGETVLSEPFELRITAPKGTPGAIIQKLNTTVTDILKDDDVKAKFERLGVQVEIMDVNATAKFIAAERVRWGEIIRSAHVTID